MGELIECVVFDADDTLWLTEHLYDRVRNEIAELLVVEGFDGHRWRAEQARLDLANAKTMGVSRRRFPLSSLQAYELITAQAGLRAGVALAARIEELANSVFERPAPLVPKVHDVLDELGRSLTLMLLTKGDVDVQLSRLSASGLEDFFSQVRVVPEKTCRSFVEIVQAESFSPSACVSVGNSLHSDIVPSLEAGLRAVLVPAYVWEFERFERKDVPSGVPVLDQLADLPGCLMRWPA